MVRRSESLMRKKSNYIIPIFVPFLGCPHKCVFCDQEKITGIDSSINQLNVTKTLHTYLKTIQEKTGPKNIEVGYYGGSFTGLPFNVQEELLKPATELKEAGLINGIRLSTRPDYINRQVLLLLKKHQVTTIELGVQSLDKKVLMNSKRGHSITDVFNSVNLIREFDFFLGIQLMIGLPGDSKEKAINSAKTTVTLAPDFVRIYPTVVIKDTELHELYLKGLYHPWNLEDTIDVCKNMLYIFSKNHIKIIRIGLQDTVQLKEKYIVAGPHHPAIGELVQSAVFLDMIEYLLNINQKVSSIENEWKSYTVYCWPNDESKVRGQKNKNIMILKKKYPNINITIKTNTNLSPHAISLNRTNDVTTKNLLTKQEFIGLKRI